MSFDLKMSSMTQAELIAIDALMEFHTTIRVYNKDKPQEEHELESTPGCSGVTKATQAPVQKSRAPSVEPRPSTSRGRPKRKCSKELQPKSNKKKRVPDAEVLQLPILESFESMIVKMHDTMESWIARIYVYEDSSDEDER